MPLDFRAVVNLGCLAGVERSKAQQLRGQDIDTFELSWLQFKTLSSYQYLEPSSYKYIYLYHHKVSVEKLNMNHELILNHIYLRLVTSTCGV